MSQHFQLLGENFVALPEKALYWPAQSTVFVADVHLGKAAAFRAAMLPIPGGTTTSTLARLSHVLQATGASRLIILGDLWHAKAGRAPQTLDAVYKWRENHADVEMTLVEGNHDRRSGKLPADMGMEEVAEPFQYGPFALCHYPEAGDQEEAYTLSGHIHPAALLNSKAGTYEKFPCFWFRDNCGVLPAFGDFTGVSTVRPDPNDLVFIVAESHVFCVSEKKEMRNELPA